MASLYRKSIRKTRVRKSPVRKTRVRKTRVRKSPVRKSPVRKSPVRKSPVRKSPVRKTRVRKSPVRKSPVRKTRVRKSPVRKTRVRKSPVRKTRVRKSPGNSGYKVQLTTKNVDIKYSTGLVKKGSFYISIDKNGIYIYIIRDNYRIYWIGRKEGESAKLSVKFNDNKKMITINNSNKIIFHNAKDYEKIKEKTIYYKLMKKDENIVVFV
jgi:hypothetical protein